MVARSEIEISPFDLPATTAQQLLGKFDPTGKRGRDAFRKVHADAAGNIVAWRFTKTETSLVIEVEGDRTGLLESVVRQFPLSDGADSFQPHHPILKKLANAKRGLRIMRMPWIFDVAAGAVLQQRVRWEVGYGDFYKIARRFGTRTPYGSAFPSSTQLANVPLFRIEQLGIDGKRARALHQLAKADATHRFLHPDADVANVTKRMLSIRGIGPWTAALVTGYAYGDTDAVPVGDLHIPSMVTSALANEEEGADERMLQLLEPYRGQRFRVIRLLTWAWRLNLHRLVPASSQTEDSTPELAS